LELATIHLDVRTKKLNNTPLKNVFSLSLSTSFQEDKCSCNVYRGKITTQGKVGEVLNFANVLGRNAAQ
jgi:hypothetical protein